MYHRVLSSIAFYPVLIGFIFLICSIALLSFETIEFAKVLKEKAPFLHIQDTDTAKTILSTLIGGILSLTVFSFSMVMLVLNQASSNFSPRLLPGLISDKKHQIILGFYVGTLIHSLLVLIALGTYDASNDSIGFSTMIAAILGILCVALFIYFIHTISNAIRIDNIVTSNFRKGLECIKTEEDLPPFVGFNESENWRTYTSRQSGYYMGCKIHELDAHFAEGKNSIEIHAYRDQHLWEGTPLFSVENKVPDKALQSLYESLEFTTNKYETDTYVSSMITLIEIAVKALSPGINDPGTAIGVIRKLGVLLSNVVELPKKHRIINNNNQLTIIQQRISINSLLFLTVQPIRNFGKKDPSILIELVKMLAFLAQKSKDLNDKNAIREEIERLDSNIDAHISNQQDRAKIRTFIN